MHRSRRAVWALGALAWGLTCGAPTIAAAQAALPTATVLLTQRTGVEEGTGAAFDRTVRSRLDGLHVVEVQGAVALDLEQIQLALGCLGETATCLDAIATEMSASIIIVPSLALAGGTLQATILVFDARDDTIRRTTREAAGAAAEAEILGGAEGMLREAFGLPPPVEEAHRDDGTGPAVTPPPSRSISAAPIAVMAGGGVVLVAGVIAGGLYLADAALYATPVNSMEEVDRLPSIRDRANAEGLAATILMIGGGAILAGGLVWLLAAGNEDGSSPLAVLPMVGPEGASITLAGSIPGDL